MVYSFLGYLGKGIFFSLCIYVCGLLSRIYTWSQDGDWSLRSFGNWQLATGNRQLCLWPAQRSAYTDFRFQSILKTT